MAKPMCAVFIPETLELAFPFVVAMLKVLGLSIVNPGNMRITTWTDEGDQLEIFEANVSQEVNLGTVRNVQFWRTASEDVFVSWEELQGGCMFSFYFGGVSDDLSVALTSKFAEIVLKKFRAKYRDGPALTIAFE